MGRAYRRLPRGMSAAGQASRELDWTYGYPLAMGVVAVLCVGIFRRFRRAGRL